MTKRKGLDVADMKSFILPPPLLSTESTEQFEKIFDQVTTDLKPQNVLELMAIRDYVYYSWLTYRYNLHQTVAIERQFQQTLQVKAEELKFRKAQKETLARELAEKHSTNPSDIARLIQLEKSIGDLAEAIDEILKRAPTQIDHNRALEKSLVFIEGLDVLLARATARRNDAFKLFTECGDLGVRLRRTTEEILDAEFNEVDGHLEQNTAPPLVPSDHGTALTLSVEGAPLPEQAAAPSDQGTTPADQSAIPAASDQGGASAASDQDATPAPSDQAATPAPSHQGQQ